LDKNGNRIIIPENAKITAIIHRIIINIKKWQIRKIFLVLFL
jgi:hypothetical protein